jgi:Uma2 family endonuclease
MTKESMARTLGFTWDDYRSWNDGQRWEVVRGEAYAMTPAPRTRHQKVQQEFSRQLGNFFLNRPCDIYPAPTDVKLSEEDVVQPDLVVVCDPEQVKSTHIEGPPALVVEILSPSTEALDRGRKMDLYARCGIREVWLVTPYPRLLEVYLLADNAYRLVHTYSEYARNEVFGSPTFPELELDLEKLFDFPIPPEERIEMVREGHPPYGSRGGEDRE